MIGRTQDAKKILWRIKYIFDVAVDGLAVHLRLGRIADFASTLISYYIVARGDSLMTIIQWFTALVLLISSLGISIYAFYTSSPYIIQYIGVSMGLLLMLTLVPLLRRPIVRRKPIRLGENLPNLINEIRLAHDSIRIISGEAHPIIFDDLRSIEAFKDAHKRGVNIEMICGPIIAVDDNSKDMSRKLFDLAEKKIISLSISRERQSLHFTLVDNSFVYEEAYHNMLDPTRLATTIENSFWEANRLNNIFNKQKMRATPFEYARDGETFKLLYESQIRELTKLLN
jgi:hypothetical protein